MRTLKHLPVSEWPEADRTAFRAAYEPGDLFDGTAGPGAHLAEGTRRAIEFTYRRWLGFLRPNHPEDFVIAAAERITPERVRAFIDHLSAEIGLSSVAVACDRLCAAARLLAPTTDWSWLRSIKARLAALACPEDRFDRLVPPWQTLDFGIELMEIALALPIEDLKQRAIEYRDGLLVALLSLWPIRRRSLAALTVSRHIEFVDAGVNILLPPADTKSRRAESFRVPEQFLSHITRYLKDVRPLLVGTSVQDAFWVSNQGRPLCGQKLYEIVRARMIAKFGKAMSIHDFRRAAATYLAMDAPEKIGLIPGVLQHASPDVSDQHYNLARSMKAGRRFATHLSDARNRLRPLAAGAAFPEQVTSARTSRDQYAIDRTARDAARMSDDPCKQADRGEPSCA